MTKILIESGLNQSKEDPCLFFTRREDEFLYCGIYVNDMPIVSSDEEFEKDYINKIKQIIDTKNLGEAKMILGMQMDQEEEKIYVHQKKYIERLLEIYGIKKCNSRA